MKNIILVSILSFFLAACATIKTEMGSNGQPLTPTESGVRYLLGRGVPQDNAKAFEYFTQGAKQDDAFAQNELAYMYAAGKGTPKDNQKALEFYEKAANHNLASAQFNLGLMYIHGLGTPVDKEKGMQWIQKAATNNFEPAKKMLAGSN